jgi:hypothetical protein
MYLVGSIAEIGDVQTYGASGFRRRDVILKTEDKYPQEITVEFHQEKIDVINNLKVGQNTKIYINILGKKYTDKNGALRRFNTIKGWKVEAADSSAVTSSDHSPDREEDLPF